MNSTGHIQLKTSNKTNQFLNTQTWTGTSNYKKLSRVSLKIKQATLSTMGHLNYIFSEIKRK